MGIPTIILCGGIGTRLKEETEYRPKPMVQVGGKPLLWHIMKNYDSYEYKDFVLALGYKGDYIKQFFMNQSMHLSNFTIHTKSGEVSTHDRCMEDDFKITFVDTGDDTLTGERVLRLKNYIDGDIFMVTYGDGLSDVDVLELIKFHKSQGTIGTITGVNPNSRFGLVNINDAGIVTGFQQKPKLHDFVNGGYMVFNREFFDHLRPGDMIEYALARLVEKGQLSLYKHDGFWFAVDTIRDLEEANKLWDDEGGPWAKNWRGNESDCIGRSFNKETANEEFLKKINEK